MPERIPGAALSAATLAMESRPPGTPAARLAMVALEAAVPILRAAAVTEWALSYVHQPKIPGLPAHRHIQPYPDEAMAREAVDAVLGEAPEDEPKLMRREIGPWKEAPDA